MERLLKDCLSKCGFLFLIAHLTLVAAPNFEPLRVACPSEQIQVQSVKDLMRRRLPAVADHFDLAMLPQENGFDVFEVESVADRICVRGSSGVALATGWNWYLKHVCQQQMSWCGSRMTLKPDELKPVPGGKFRQVLPHKKVAYMNYCTLSYSMAWWDWERWEWETDYLAMNGVNMPLGIVGVEAVWYNALTTVGLTDLEARTFLSGPAYHAWQWMQNLEGEAGPLPKSWIDSHAALGKRLFERQRSFGMTPIQQGFSGHVPRLFKEKFPQAKIRLQGNWCDCPGVAQLDPLDPLFSEFGSIFMEEQGKLFGLGGFYAADPFHESQPPSDIQKEALPKYLDDVGKSIHRVMDVVDPKSTWVMQSWTIRQDIACAVPHGRLLVLDLAGDKWKRTDGFWGHNFTTGQLHNFGGRIELHGNLDHIAKNNPIRAKEQYPQTAFGTGLFMEGIIQNPAFYDLVLDTWWTEQAVDLTRWVPEYVARRYGVSGGTAQDAWDILTTKGPYKPGAAGIEWGSIICARPALDCKKSGPNGEFHMEYKPEELLKAWELLLSDQKRCGAADGYRFDVMDIGRQVLSNFGKVLHEEVRQTFLQQNKDEFAAKTALFIDLLKDVDRLCETRGEYRFGDWLASARKWGSDEVEKAYYDKNASILLTLWGPEKSPVVNFDYSWREWSGLIREFYIPRWKMFHEMLAAKLTKGESYSEEGIPMSCGRPSWRANEFFSQMADWETKWVNTPKSNWQKLDVGNGDEIAVANQLLAKWGGVIKTFQVTTKPVVSDPPVAPASVIALEWTPKIVDTSWREIEVDGSSFIKGEGIYEIEFRFKAGWHALVIEHVSLLQGGIELMRDTHPGWAGNFNRSNVYRANLAVLANGAKYSLKFNVRGEGGKNSNGEVIVRKVARN